MTKRATLADVAKLAGLSTTTVSMVLNNRPNTRLSEQAAERVRAAAAALDYRPNPAARGLRTGTTRTIGFISDEVTVTRYASAIISGLLEEAEAHDHSLLITESGRPGQLAKLVNLMLDRRTDGIVFGLMRARQLDLPPLREVNTILVNATSTSGHPCVLPDEYRAGYQAVKYLTDRGHRRIGFIGRSSDLLEPASSATVAERYAGMDAALAEDGIELVRQIDGKYWEPELGYSGTEEILAAGPVTAIISANDRVAFGVYQAAQERGLKVPDDLSVISFDDEYLASYLRPQLTTMQIPYRLMGQTAMRLLLGRNAPPLTLVPMPVQERGSVRTLR